MKQKSRLFSKQFIVLFLALFASGYCLYCLNSTVSLYVDSLGGGAGTSGILNTCFTASACIARLAGGHCADRFGRKRIILAGGILIALGTLAYSMISIFPLLLLFRCIQGVGYAVMSVGASTALIDILPKDRLGEGIGVSALASTLAGSIAPSVGVAISLQFDYRAVFLSTSAVALTGVLSVLLFCNYEKRSAPLSDSVPQVAQEKTFFLWRILERQAIAPAAVYMFFTIGFSITHVFMTLYAVSSGIVNPGSYFIASSLCQVVARVVAGKFADRENVIPIILVGGIAACLSYGGLALTANAAVYLLSGALFGIGNGMVGPVMNRLAVMNAAPQRRGAASATYYISADLGNGIGGLLWGNLIDAFSYQTCFTIVTGWLTMALVISMGYLLYHQKGRKHAKENTIG